MPPVQLNRPYPLCVAAVQNQHVSVFLTLAQNRAGSCIMAEAYHLLMPMHLYYALHYVVHIVY